MQLFCLDGIRFLFLYIDTSYVAHVSPPKILYYATLFRTAFAKPHLTMLTFCSCGYLTI